MKKDDNKRSQDTNVFNVTLVYVSVYRKIETLVF
jgi:hypothetical protein